MYIFSEKQQRLLTETLHSSWSGPGEGRPFVATANVGVFYLLNGPPLVPDVFLSLDVKLPEDIWEKRHRSYFVWEYGKPPDVVIEIVSNRTAMSKGVGGMAMNGCTFPITLSSILFGNSVPSSFRSMNCNE